MKERPILFSAPMVRAILAGTKTQTRRVAKGLALEWLSDGFTPEFVADYQNRLCPYGQPGDRLWVREAWAHDDKSGALLFRADNNEATRRWERARVASGPQSLRWRPSIHMPRWASRILLEIVSVRVERLQEIGEADAVAEGMTRQLRSALGWAAEESVEAFNARQARSTFGVLWDSINGPGSWAANPWVWVVEFKRVTP